MVDALQQLVHVDQLLRWRAPGPEHGIEKIGQTVRFADDDARVFAQRRIQEFPFEQLRGAAQAAERVFDFVRELADHQAASSQLRQQRVLASQAPMLRDVFDFQQQPGLALSESDLSDGAVENTIDSARRRPRQFALYHRLTSLPRAIEQRQQGLGAARQFGDAPAECLVGTQAQQGLRGGIQIAYVQTLIEQKHAGHQPVKQLGALDMNGVLLEFSGQSE